MDKIWYRNPSKSEVIGHVAGVKKRMTMQNRQKSNAKKPNKLCKYPYGSLYLVTMYMHVGR